MPLFRFYPHGGNMTPKEYCESQPTIAFHYIFGGIEAKPIKYVATGYLYVVTGACSKKKTYHKCQIYYDDRGGYIVLQGKTIYLSEFIRV